MNGSQTPAQLVEEGVTLDWRDRLRTAAAITRQDTADETLPAGQTFDAVAYKGLGPQDGGAQVVLAANHSSHTAQVALGAAGHGVLEVGVDARLAVDLPDGSTPTVGLALSGGGIRSATFAAGHKAAGIDDTDTAFAATHRAPQGRSTLRKR